MKNFTVNLIILLNIIFLLLPEKNYSRMFMNLSKVI